MLSIKSTIYTSNKIKYNVLVFTWWTDYKQKGHVASSRELEIENNNSWDH